MAAISFVNNDTRLQKDNISQLLIRKSTETKDQFYHWTLEGQSLKIICSTAKKIFLKASYAGQQNIRENLSAALEGREVYANSSSDTTKKKMVSIVFIPIKS